MDIRNYVKIDETIKIHEELFEKSLYNDYFNYGIAKGLFSIYDMLNEVKVEKVTTSELMQIIRGSVDFNENISKYFSRLLGELENKSKSKINNLNEG